MATQRLDRVVLLLLGLLLTAAGVLALLAGAGVLGRRTADAEIVDNPVSRAYGDQGAWLWPVTAAVALVLGLLALRWLVAQLRPTRVGDVELEPNGRTGHTELASSAVTDAVLAEVRGYHGVAGASGALRGTDTDPRLELTVRLAARADVAAVRRRIEAEPVAHVREALDDETLPVRLDLVVTDAGDGRRG